MTATSLMVTHDLRQKTRYAWASQAAKYSGMLSFFVLPLSTSALYVALSGVVIFSLLSGHLREKVALYVDHPVTKITLALFGLFLLGCLYSVGSAPEISRILSKMSKLLYVPFLMFAFSEQKWRYKAIAAFILAMLISMVADFIKASLLFFSTGDWPSHTIVFKNHIDTNLMMAFSVFILAQIVASNIAPKMKFYVQAVIFIMTLYVIGWSQGRSGYVVFIALWGLFCIQHLNFRKSLLAATLLTLILGSAAFFSKPFQSRLSLIPIQIQQYQEGDTYTSVGLRIQFFQVALLLAKERPWFGWGTGSLTEKYSAYAKEHNLVATDNPHNEYLNIFFQLGIVGFLAYLAVFIALLKAGFALPLFERRILQGALLAMAIGCLANCWLRDFTPGYWFVLMVALCGASLKQKSSETVSEIEKMLYSSTSGVK